MKAPRTYTREDIVEIQCHGGYLILQKVLELVLEQGARMAQPGEFTKRAFLNGRIDLTQAEAVIDLIRAKTMAGLEIANQQLRGMLFQGNGFPQRKVGQSSGPDRGPYRFPGRRDRIGFFERVSGVI